MSPATSPSRLSPGTGHDVDDLTAGSQVVLLHDTALLVLLAVGLAVGGVNPMPSVLGFVPFAIIHGVRRYGWPATT
jgi:hypothetical protein